MAKTRQKNGSHTEVVVVGAEDELEIAADAYVAGPYYSDQTLQSGVECAEGSETDDIQGPVQFCSLKTLRLIVRSED